MMNKRTLVALYLSAIVAANLSIAVFGPEASIVNAFLLVGLVLSTRDGLHDAWGSRPFKPMAALILVGGVLSYISSLLLADPSLPPGIVATIALASVAAFASAEMVDAFTYHSLKRRGWGWMDRSNGSNLPAAAVDSVVFVLIAFGWDWEIAFAQFAAKVGGALVWSLIIERIRRVRVAT